MWNFIFKSLEMCTYHHIQWKSALWAEVLELAEDREHFLLPNFNEYHSMNQCRNLHKKTFSKYHLILPHNRQHYRDSEQPLHLSYLYKWHQKVFDKLLLISTGMKNSLHIEFLNVFVLPKPPIAENMFRI